MSELGYKFGTFQHIPSMESHKITKGVGVPMNGKKEKKGEAKLQSDKWPEREEENEDCCSESQVKKTQMRQAL